METNWTCPCDDLVWNWNGTWNETNSTGWCKCEQPWNGPTRASTAFQVAIYLLYCTIFVFGLCGNGLVCYIVLSSSRMRTVTNYFIVNLAVGDILMTVFCVPFSFVSILLLQYWLFGEEMCRIVSYTQAVSVFVSAYTLVAISMDRYMAILYPFRHRVTHLQAKLIILIVWLVAILTALPVAIVTKLHQPDPWFVHHERYICGEVWDSDEQRYYYSMALMGLQYFLPLFVLVFSYTRIAFVVWGKKPPGEAEDNRDQRMARTKRKMVKMMVACVCAYTLAWLPLNCLLILMDLCPAVLQFRYMKVVWFLVHWLAMSHTCYNPLIYFMMNSKFRLGFYQALNCCPCIRVPYRYAGVGQASPHSVYTSIHLNTASTFRSGRKGPEPAIDRSTMIKMMVMVVIVFTVCWLPFNTLVVILDQYPAFNDWEGMMYVWCVCHWLAMSHTCYNPIIYFGMNTNFRKGFRAVLVKIPVLRNLAHSGMMAESLHRTQTATTYTSVRTGSNRSRLSSCRASNSSFVRTSVNGNGATELLVYHAKKNGPYSPVDSTSPCSDVAV